MDNAIETIEYRGFNIGIYQDDNPMNPRTEQDNLCAMVCWHRRYDLGDKHKFSDPDDFQDWMEAEGYKPDKNIFLLPLYLYDHSGLSISTGSFSCSWYSSQVGWIYLTAERYKAECLRPGKLRPDGINHELHPIKHITAKDRSRIDELLKGEVKEYDQYLTWRVYGFMIEPTDRNKSIDCGDSSCWGFYGDTDYMISEAKSSIDYAIKAYREKVKAEYAKRKAVDALVKNSFAL